MKGKKKIAMVLFFLLGISTLLFGAFVMYNTFKIDSFDGSTIVIGRVVDSDEQPLEGVQISCKHHFSLTDGDGYFKIRNVEEGMIKLYLYKPGYVRTSLNWIAYPMSEIDNELAGSANDISESFDIELKKEMEHREIDGYENGTLTLEIFAEPGSDLEDLQLDISGINVKLEAGLNSYQVVGNGSYRIMIGDPIVGFSLPGIRGFHPVGNTINITEIVNSSIPAVGMIQEYMGANATLDITVGTDRSHENVSFTFKPLDGGTGHEFISSVKEDSPISYNVPPGVYALEVTGGSIRDRTFKWIVVNESEEKSIGIEIVKADTDSIYNLSLNGNYVVAVVYLLVAILIFGGGYLLRRNGPWGWIVAASLLGFITQGFFALLIFNINHVITILLVVVLFYIRSDLNKIRERRRKARL